MAGRGEREHRGYGDVVPRTLPGRLLTLALILTGAVVEQILANPAAEEILRAGDLLIVFGTKESLRTWKKPWPPRPASPDGLLCRLGSGLSLPSRAFRSLAAPKGLRPAAPSGGFPKYY